MGFRQNSAAEDHEYLTLWPYLRKTKRRNLDRSQKCRGNAPTFSEKKQVTLSSKAKAMGFRQNFCYGKSQVSGFLLLRDLGSDSDRSQE
jgi:hypothetical protein